MQKTSSIYTKLHATLLSLHKHKEGEAIRNQKRTRGVSHFGLAIYIKKYLKANEELWKLKYFTMQKI
jgi:hypothetical protein